MVVKKNTSIVYDQVLVTILDHKKTRSVSCLGILAADIPNFLYFGKILDENQFKDNTVLHDFTLAQVIGTF